MDKEKKFLVLVDGSERSIQTVNYVKDFMPVDDCTRIVLFHVFPGLAEEYRDLEKDSSCAGASSQLSNWETQEKRKILAILEWAKKILTQGGFPESCVEIKLHPLEKGVARDILEEAKNGYTAVILRRRGMGVLKSIIVGSVAVKLLQSLTFVPIIIVGKTLPVKKLLLAVDTSPCAMKAVEFTGSILGNSGYEVFITHAILRLGSINFELPGKYTQACPEIDMPENCIEVFKLKIIRLFQTIEEKLLAWGFKPENISENIISGVHSRS